MTGKRTSVEAWLSLSLVPGLTPAALRRLIAKFGSPDELLSRSPLQIAKVAGDAARQALGRGPDPKQIESTLAWARMPGCHVVPLDDPRYPPLLREIVDPPLVLYARGRAELLQSPGIAVVGSRAATTQGCRNAMAFARALSDAGLCIVSGMAQGIDAAAHRGGLDGHAASIAVLGTGIDRVYPARNAELARELSERGLLVTEFALGAPPMPAHFPRRNRIISGLSRGCLVVEAALASGSLITARMAADQGRDVLAIPGSIHSAHSKGCHHLIKQGAKLVECAQDVLDELGGEWQGSLPLGIEAERGELSADARRLLDAIGFDPSGIDAVADQMELPVEHVSAVLLELELAGAVEMLAGGRVQRIR